MNPTVESLTAVPAAPLRGFVDRYVGYRLAGFPPGLHRGLPSRHMTFIASIGPPIDVLEQNGASAQGEVLAPAGAGARPRAGQEVRRFGCVVSGLQATPAVIAHGGDQEGVAVELTPLGSRALLGRPAAELAGRSVELDEVVGSAGSELWERLQEPASWPRRFAICDEILTRLVRQRPVARPLGRCWQAVLASGGTLSVEALADATGWSRQHLTRRFRQEFGLAPKVAARVVRFERARRLLQRPGPRPALADVALACGYFDQAHLDRDFRDFAGCAPTRWLAEEVPIVQDEEGTGR